MKTRPLPADQVRWIPYQCAGLLVRLGLVSCQAELAHRRLADYHWETGLWVQARARFTLTLTRATSRRWPATLRELQSLGWRCVNGALHHHHVRRARADAVLTLRRSQAGGHLGAARRWGRSRPRATRTSKPGPPTASPIGPPSGPSITPPMTITVHEHNSTAPDKALNDAERSTLSASPPSSKGSAEQKFLAHVMEVMATWNPKEGSTELTNWGGWWRNRFRENPDKARRILAEVNLLIREHRITGSPGAAAGDLWKRLP